MLGAPLRRLCFSFRLRKVERLTCTGRGGKIREMTCEREMTILNKPVTTNFSELIIRSERCANTTAEEQKTGTDSFRSKRRDKISS